MKKIIISLITLLMFFTNITVNTVFAEEEPEWEILEIGETGLMFDDKNIHYLKLESDQTFENITSFPEGAVDFGTRTSDGMISAISIKNGTTVVLDLNGYKLSSGDNSTIGYMFGLDDRYSYLSTNKNKLIIEDSSENKTGEINMSSTSSVTNEGMIRLKSSEFVLNGGTLKSSLGKGYATVISFLNYYGAAQPLITINGGQIISDTTCIRGIESIVTVNDGVLTAPGEAIHAGYSSLYINGGSITSLNDDAIYFDGYTIESEKNKMTLKINGGSISGESSIVNIGRSMQLMTISGNPTFSNNCPVLYFEGNLDNYGNKRELHVDEYTGSSPITVFFTNTNNDYMKAFKTSQEEFEKLLCLNDKNLLIWDDETGISGIKKICIDLQPTNNNPSILMSLDNESINYSYEWYKINQNSKIINAQSDNIETSYNMEGIIEVDTTCDEDGFWTPTLFDPGWGTFQLYFIDNNIEYGAMYKIEMKSDKDFNNFTDFFYEDYAEIISKSNNEVIYKIIDPDYTSSSYMCNYYNADEQTEDIDFIDSPVKIRVTKINYDIDENPIEGQTSNTLTVKEDAVCKVSWTKDGGNGFEWSNPVYLKPEEPSIDVNQDTGVATISPNGKTIEKVYIYKAKNGVNALENETNNPGYYTSYSALTRDGENFKTYIASETSPINEQTVFKFDEAGQYIIRIKYVNDGSVKYSSFVLDVKEENIKSVEPKMTLSDDGKFVILDLNGCENIQKLYVGYAPTENVEEGVDYTSYANYTSTVESYKTETNITNDKQYILERPGYSYVFRVKYEDLDGSAKYVSYVFESPSVKDLGTTTAYLDINKNVIKVKMDDGRSVSEIKLLNNDKLVTSNTNKASITAPFNGNYVVSVKDIAGYEYRFNADICLTNLGEIKDIAALRQLISNIRTSLADVTVSDSNIIRPNDEAKPLSINSVSKDALDVEINNAVEACEDETKSQKDITDAYNSLVNAYNLFLSKLQVNVLSVSNLNEDGTYTITIAENSNNVEIETVYIKGGKGANDSQGVFLEDYADFISDGGRHQALKASTQDKPVTTTRAPGLYTVRYKVKLTNAVGENEFRAASYLVLCDEDIVKDNLDLNVYGGLDMYRKAYNLGFIENTDESKDKEFAKALKEVLENVDETVIETNRTIDNEEMSLNVSNELYYQLEYDRPQDLQSCINHIIEIREKLADMPKLSDSANKSVYKSYLLATNVKSTTKDFNDNEFNSAVVKVSKGNENPELDIRKDGDLNNINVKDTQYVRIGVNNVSNIRVAFGDFDASDPWSKFASAPYSTYYDSIVDYTPKWKGKYTVRIKYFNNTYEYLHFEVTGGTDDPVTITKDINNKSFKITANEGFNVTSAEYAYSEINDGNYWPVNMQTDTALALGAGEHTFKIKATDSSNAANVYYVKVSGDQAFTNDEIKEPVVVYWNDNSGTTVVGIYSGNLNSLSVAYAKDNDWNNDTNWSDVQQTSNITYTVKNGAIDFETSKKVLKFAFALGNNNVIIKDAISVYNNR